MKGINTMKNTTFERIISAVVFLQEREGDVQECARWLTARRLATFTGLSYVVVYSALKEGVRAGYLVERTVSNHAGAGAPQNEYALVDALEFYGV